MDSQAYPSSGQGKRGLECNFYFLFLKVMIFSFPFWVPFVMVHFLFWWVFYVKASFQELPLQTFFSSVRMCSAYIVLQLGDGSVTDKHSSGIVMQSS